MKQADDRPVSPTTARRVLVVEDDQDSRELLIELIEYFGHYALGCATPAEALRIGQEAHLDFVLIDLGLGDASGCDVARSLRALPHGASFRLVALTGYSDAATRRLAAEAGFDDYVVKPFSAEALDALLGAQL